MEQVFWLVLVAADLSSHQWRHGMSSNIHQITVWFGTCMFCSLLYVSPWRHWQVTPTQRRKDTLTFTFVRSPSILSWYQSMKATIHLDMSICNQKCVELCSFSPDHSGHPPDIWSGQILRDFLSDSASCFEFVAARRSQLKLTHYYYFIEES